MAVRRGDLVPDADGNFDRDEVEIFAERLLTATLDPAIEYLKHGLDVMTSHFSQAKEHNEGIYKLMLGVITDHARLQKEEIETQRKQLNEALQVQFEMARAFREVMTMKEEQEAAALERKTKAEATSEFVNLAKDAVGHAVQSKMLAPHLREFVDTLAPDQMLGLTKVLDRGQLAKLQKLTEILEPEEPAKEPKGDAEAAE